MPCARIGRWAVQNSTEYREQFVYLRRPSMELKLMFFVIVGTLAIAQGEHHLHSTSAHMESASTSAVETPLPLAASRPHMSVRVWT